MKIYIVSFRDSIKGGYVQIPFWDVLKLIDDEATAAWDCYVDTSQFNWEDVREITLGIFNIDIQKTDYGAVILHLRGTARMAWNFKINKTWVPWINNNDQS